MRNTASKSRWPIGYLIFALALSMSVAVGFLGARGLGADREAAVRLAEVQSRNLAQAVDQNLARLVQRIDAALTTLTGELEGNLARGGADLPRIAHLVASQEKLLPEVLAIRISDAQGTVVLGQPVPGSIASIADRPYFPSLRDHPGLGTVVTHPVRGAFEDTWLIIAARRYQLPDGRFGGLVVAPIFLDRFQEAITGFEVGAGGFLELRDDQGLFIARNPMTVNGRTHERGDPRISDQLRTILAAGTQRTTYHLRTVTEQEGRIISFRRLQSAPIIVLACQAEQDYLALWRRERLQTLSLVGAFLAGLWGLAWILWTSFKAREASEVEQRRLQAQFLHAQKMDSLGSLAGGVAHDMNNVLGAILALATASMARLPRDERAYKAFDTIAQAATRGGKMLKGLLNFARKDPVQERAVDLNALLREQAELLEHTTLARVRLVLDLDPGLSPMSGDAGALAHAIINLCVNAVDAMPEGGTLTLRTRPGKDGQVEVQVEDTGTGMPPEVLQRAMDPFYTTKPMGKGTGLGLAMVYSAVQSHRGTMELSSVPGRGTCVTLRFPARAPGTAPAEPARTPVAAGSPAALDVLLVDDDELIQMSVQVLLETLGHRVRQALSGEEALAMLEAGASPDLVILDLNMPGLGGGGTLPRLRALRPGLPVLLATGRADQTAVDLAGSAKGVTLVSKPFDLTELQDYLAKLFP